MKMLKYTFGLLVGAVVFLSSCRDTVDPNIPYKDFDTGAYLRTIDRTSTTFNYFDLGSSNFALTLEAVDSEDGASVETVDINVQHRRLIEGVGLEYTPSAGPITVKTLSASDFGPNSDSRFLRASFVITAAEALAAVGLTEADIEGGDVFEFSLELHDKYGRTFNRENVSGNIAGAPFYASPFQYFVSVICPVGSTYAVGNYALTQTAGGEDPFFGNDTRFVEETVTLATVSGNSTRRSFTVKYLGGFTTRTFTIEFSCGQVIKPEESAGAGCGGTIYWVSDNADLASYDVSDDSVIKIKFVDDNDDDCGVKQPIELTLTKL